MSKEGKRKAMQDSDLETVLGNIRKEAEEKSKLSDDVDLIVEWLVECGLDFESNGEEIEPNETLVAPDEDYDELLQRAPLVEDEPDVEEVDNLLLGNGEEHHAYKFYQFKRKHEKVKYNAIGTDDFETIQSNEGRILAIEHTTKQRKISLIAYAEDAHDETPYPQPEKSFSMLVEFDDPGSVNSKRFFLPRTNLSQIDPNNMVVIQGVINGFMNAFIALPPDNS